MPKVSEEYSKLYHYTNWDGLLGIWDSRSLWATHYKFLNDYTEIILFRDKLINLMSPHVEDVIRKLMEELPDFAQQVNEYGGVAKLIQDEVGAVVDAQYKAVGEQIYIASFCGEHEDQNINQNGLLSQWRGYGKDGGFALVFNTEKLEELLVLEEEKYKYKTDFLCEVLYSDDEGKLKDRLSDYWDVLAQDVKLLFDSDSYTGEKREFTGKLQGAVPFVKCVTRYKHYGFKEENEVRVVALPAVFSQDFLDIIAATKEELRLEKEIKFRNNGTNRIPYIELFKSIGRELPIEKIIVGPHIDKERRASTLKTMFRKTDIEIVCSDIPYICG